MKKKLSEQFDPDKPVEKMTLTEKKMFVEFYDKECGNVTWLQHNQNKYNAIKKQLSRNRK